VSKYTDYRRAVQATLAGRIFLQMDQTAPANKEISGHERERSRDPNLVCRIDLRLDRHFQKRDSTQCLALHITTDSFRPGLRENPVICLVF
jgi:hypothetical protein